ncbi:MAG: RICIN domain-containing protein, partial [Pyrinomonadaceae bacterium]
MTNQQQLMQDDGMKAVKIALFVLAVFLLNTTADAQVEAGKQFQIVALHSNKCVDVSEVSTRSGQAIHQFKCLKADNQNWQFEPKT